LFEEDMLQDVLKDGDKIWTHPEDSVAPSKGTEWLSDAFENEAENSGEAEAIDSSNDIGVEESEDVFPVEDDDQAHPVGDDEDSECPTPPPVVPDFSKTKPKAAAVPWPKAYAREEPKEPIRPRPSAGRVPQQPRIPPWRPQAKPAERSRSPPRKPAFADPTPTASSSSSNVRKESLAPKEWPPLLQAVYNNDLQQVQELLEGGADVNCSASGQKTPIYYAIRFEFPHIAECLLQHPDIDLDMQMKSGKGSWITPLDAVKDAGPSSAVYSVFQAAGLLNDQPTGFKQAKMAPREPNYPPPQRPLNAGKTPVRLNVRPPSAPIKSDEPPQKKTGTAVQYGALYARRRASYGKN
jgi:hypothetical protein